MNHYKAMALLQDAMDGRLSLDEQPALERHLAGCARCRAYAEGLLTLEENLRHSLQERYPESLAEPRLPAFDLGKFQTYNRRMQMSKSTLRGFAWLVLAALFVITLSWVFRTFIPKPILSSLQTVTPSLTTTLESGPAPILTDIPTEIPTLAPTATPSAPSTGTSPIFPNLTFSLGVPLPDSPQAVAAYTQSYPQPATLDTVHQLAQRLGLDAPIYSYPGEGTDPVYIVSDGYRWLNVAFGTADIFTYYADYRDILSNSGEAPSYEQALASATDYLQQIGFVDGPFTAEPLPDKPGGVRFHRLLDGNPLVFGVGLNPSAMDLDIVIDKNGQIKELDYAAQTFQRTGEYNILSAQQAWQAILENRAPRRLRYAFNQPAPQNPYRSWMRNYPSGEQVDLYGYPLVLKPVDGNSTLLATINNLNMPIVGNKLSAFAAKVTPYKFLHLWGGLQEDAQGRQALDLEGWEVSKLEDLSLSGKIVRQGDQAWLETAEQGRLRLAQLPADLPDGAQVNVRGVKTASDAFEWSYIDTGEPAGSGAGIMDTCGGGGGGGGGNSFAGGGFLSTTLAGAASGSATLAAPPTPYSPFQSGEVVDGQAGWITALNHRYADGHEVLEVFLRPTATSSSEPYWQAWLSGPQTDALAKMHNLPVRVWGRVTGIGIDGYPSIEVERFEEVYPGLRSQAWLGTWIPVTLDSKEVLLFTSKEGEQFVLSGSIEMGKQSAIGIQGDPVIIEGLVEPGKTYGGYPIISEYGGQVATGRKDLNGYEIGSNIIGLWDEAPATDTSAQELKGSATVEKVELVYATAMLTRCGNLATTSSGEVPWLVVQPVWRFSGHLEDGRIFEIQVQALTGEYLK